MEQFTRAQARESRELQQVFERAIKEVERSFERSAASEPQNAVAVTATPIAPADPASRSPTRSGFAAGCAGCATPGRPMAAPRSPDQPKRSSPLTFLVRLAAILLLMAGASAAGDLLPRLKTKVTAVTIGAASRAPAEQPRAPGRRLRRPFRETVERSRDSAKKPAPPAQPSMPLPTTFGVYALKRDNFRS